MRGSIISRRAWVALLAIGLSACNGFVTDLEPRRPGARDGGPDGGGYDGECGDTGRALLFLEQRCTNSACHAGRQYPLLTRAGLRELSSLESHSNPGQRLLVPGDPSASWLYLKMADMQGDDGGALMPLGVSSPVSELSLIEGWIRDGASTDCGDLPPESLPTDPNVLDQGALFTCADPSAPRSSPARLRRIESQELTHAAVRSINGTWWGSTMKDNPFTVPDGLPYSTYTENVSVDPATLDLYMLNLDEAGRLYDKRDPLVGQEPAGAPSAERVRGLYDNASIRCIFDDAAPDSACIDQWVDLILRRGLLFREPTAGEHQRLAAFAARHLAAETDIAQRQSTLLHVAQGAFLMSGTLFRPEMGEVPGAEPSAMTNDELALALGHVLNTHPTGAFISVNGPDASDPDAMDPSLGRMGAIRQAAIDGTIQDPAVRRALFRQYASGISQERPDISFDSDDRDLMRRGEYWLAPGLARFFREYFDYENANSAFKDRPGATSRWDGTYTGDPMWDPTTNSYGNLQDGYYGYESLLTHQLDDTIARIVIESDASGQDVFRELLTSRLWRLPSNLADTNGQACSDSSDCTDSSYASCTPIGICGSSVSGASAPSTRVYNTENVPDTPAGRWVMMPANERAGVLTHPAWLGAHGGNFEDDASLVHRGRWIRERLFCQTVPPLELVMVEALLVPSAPDQNARSRITRSIDENPDSATCLGCHSQMNPLGVAFETYNHAGFLRAMDHGAPPSGATMVDNLPDPALNRAYANPIEMVEAFADSAYARRGFIRHAFRYFMGRGETLADACTLTEMEAALASSGSFFDMMEALVSSETFSHRRVEGGP
ncbi:MAG: DUF1588 domain-containing protein [Sandaracinaceae bacterium]